MEKFGVLPNVDYETEQYCLPLCCSKLLLCMNPILTNLILISIIVQRFNGSSTMSSLGTLGLERGTWLVVHRSAFCLSNLLLNILTAEFITTPRICPLKFLASLFETNIPAAASLYDLLEIFIRRETPSTSVAPAIPMNPAIIAKVFLSLFFAKTNKLNQSFSDKNGNACTYYFFL